MDAVAKTAYYCCGVRAADAASAKPICGDALAEEFMTEEGRDLFKHFAHFHKPNASNATRARIVDDWLRAALAANASRRVIMLGVGFDTRSFRLTGGRWLEIDQPAIVARRDAILPTTTAPNPVERLAVDFAVDSLAEKLRPWAGETGAMVVMEGVSQYLTESQLRATLGTLLAAFPGHTLICDLMREDFRLKFTAEFREQLRRFGADFETMSMDPPRAVIEAGYELMERTSMVSRARDLGAISIPGFLLHTFYRALRDGYCAYRFKAGD